MANIERYYLTSFWLTGDDKHLVYDGYLAWSTYILMFILLLFWGLVFATGLVCHMLRDALWVFKMVSLYLSSLRGSLVLKMSIALRSSQQALLNVSVQDLSLISHTESITSNTKPNVHYILCFYNLKCIFLTFHIIHSPHVHVTMHILT